jgi:hypothetical protein
LKIAKVCKLSFLAFSSIVLLPVVCYGNGPGEEYRPFKQIPFRSLSNPKKKITLSSRTKLAPLRTPTDYKLCFVGKGSKKDFLVYHKGQAGSVPTRSCYVDLLEPDNIWTDRPTTLYSQPDLKSSVVRKLKTVQPLIPEDPYQYSDSVVRSSSKSYWLRLRPSLLCSHQDSYVKLPRAVKKVHFVDDTWKTKDSHLVHSQSQPTKEVLACSHYENALKSWCDGVKKTTPCLTCDAWREQLSSEHKHELRQLLRDLRGQKRKANTKENLAEYLSMVHKIKYFWTNHGSHYNFTDEASESSLDSEHEALDMLAEQLVEEPSNNHFPT